MEVKYDASGDETMENKEVQETRFGRLTVLKKFRDDKGYAKCLCRCDCGTEKEVYLTNLLSGRTKSCGCLEKQSREKRCLNLTGQRFGRLVAQIPTTQRLGSSIVWECQCDCGNLCYASAHDLKRGDIKSCGCLRGQKSDIAGKRFGRLIAICPIRQLSSGAIWRCRCDCGSECEVSIGNLKSGHTKSCGCLRRERMKARICDLTGQQFGRLTVLEATERRQSGQIVWKCQCDCGNVAYAIKSNLSNGRVMSCGCWQKEMAVENHKKNFHYVEGTYLELIASKKIPRNNTSGIRGVHQNSETKKWVAQIMFQKKRYYLGTFNTKEEAAFARHRAEWVFEEFIQEHEFLLRAKSI